MRLSAKKNMEFFFTFIRNSDTEIELNMYNTFYKLVKVENENEPSAISDQPEEWVNAKDKKMSMSGSLANSIVEAFKNLGK